MKTVWKFLLEVTDEQKVEMPVGAKVLSVQVQGGHPCIWALVNPKAKKKICTVQIFGTGHPVAKEGVFIGTFQMQGGSLVFHAFIK